MKCKKAQVNILTVSSWQIVRIKRVTLLLRHPENKLIKSFLGTVSFSTPFGNEAWNLTNVVSTLVMGRVPRYSNNHNCSLDLFFLQLIWLGREKSSLGMTQYWIPTCTQTWQLNILYKWRCSWENPQWRTFRCQVRLPKATRKIAWWPDHLSSRIPEDSQKKRSRWQLE